MTSRHERRLLIVGIVYLLISVPVYLLTNRFMHAYYAVNVFLAFIPYVIAKYLANQKPKQPWIFGVALAVWLLFFPNAFYLWTDFIHLSGLTFYTQANPYAPLVYAQNLVDWIALIHTLFGALLGTVFGARSFWLVWHAVVKHWRKPYQAMVYLGVPLLSAVGVYIGRFLRFNSWDVLRPWVIVREFTASFNGFALGFIALFFIGQLAVLWMAESFGEQGSVRS